jgi:predicted secreted protein
MKWTSALAIFLLFWVMSAFLVMPFGVKNAHETGDALVPGQSDGAPANFNPKRILIRTTIVAAALFGLYYLNYVYGWISF